jgi:hypothetical protein
MVIPRSLNSNFRSQIRSVIDWDFSVTAVTGNLDPPEENFPIGNQNLGLDILIFVKNNMDRRE